MKVHYDVIFSVAPYGGSRKCWSLGKWRYGLYVIMICLLHYTAYAQDATKSMPAASVSSITETVNEQQLRRIFSGKKNALAFMRLWDPQTEIKSSLPSRQLYAAIQDNWAYDKALALIRQLFMETELYQQGKKAPAQLNAALKDWQANKLGAVSWPFSGRQLDRYVQGINEADHSHAEKDTRISAAAIQYRRMTDIAHWRTAYLSALVVDSYPGALPSLSRRTPIDFYFDGKFFKHVLVTDPHAVFTKTLGENWLQLLKAAPEKALATFYQKQRKTGFTAQPQLWMIFLDGEVRAEDIERVVKATDFSKPYQIDFSREEGREKMVHNYHTEAFVLLFSRKK